MADNFKPTDYPDVLVPVNGTNRYIRSIKSGSTTLWIKKWDLTVNAGTGGSITGGVSGKVVDGSSLSLTATPSSGYKFDRWEFSKSLPQKYKNNDSSATEKSTITPNGNNLNLTVKEDIEVYAIFELALTPMWMMVNHEPVGTNADYTTKFDNKYSINNGSSWSTNHSIAMAEKICSLDRKFVKLTDDADLVYDTTSRLIYPTAADAPDGVVTEPLIEYLYAGQKNRKSLHAKPIYTEDGGKTWKACIVADYTFRVSRDMISIASGHDSEGNELWISGTKDHSDEDRGGTIYYSTDGITWNFGTYGDSRYDDGKARARRHRQDSTTHKWFDTYPVGRSIEWSGSHDSAAVGIDSGADICVIGDSTCNILWVSLNKGVHWTRYYCSIKDWLIATKTGFVFTKTSTTIGYVSYQNLRTIKPEDDVPDSVSGYNGIMKSVTVNTLKTGCCLGYSPVLDRLVVQRNDGVMISIVNPTDETMTNGTWTEGTDIPYGVVKIEWGNGIFMAITKLVTSGASYNQSPSHTFISRDGITWTQVTDPGVGAVDLAYAEVNTVI